MDNTGLLRDKPLAEQTGSGAEVKIEQMPRRIANRVRYNVAGPRAGFGPLWQKVFRVRLEGVKLSPQQVIQEWKRNFSRFWPRGNYFYTPLTGITPGEVALIQTDTPVGLKFATGMVVAHSDATSFTLMPSKGHIFTGAVKFSAFEEDGVTVAQVKLLARSADPLIEVAMLAIGHEMEDEFWHDTMRALARHFGVRAKVQMRGVVVDRDIHWSHVGNIRYNPLVRTVVATISNPARLFSRRDRAVL